MNQRMDILDILKGLMVIFIIVTHFRFEYPLDYKKYGFFYWIDMAVPVFMIITGFIMSFNFNKKETCTLKEAYSIQSIIPKILRYILPFIPIFLIETPILIIYKNFGIIELLKTFVCGGVGPGSYYTPIMVQVVFLVPLIHFLVRKYDFFGVVLCFFITCFWEYVQYSWGMDTRSYSLLAFRYISIISFGCYIAVGNVRLGQYTLVTMFLSGIMWQTLLNYVPLHPPFMNYPWARVNYISVIFVMPIMYLLIKKYCNQKFGYIFFQELGKASFNVYLVQMAFYGCGPSKLVYKFVDGKLLQLFLCILLCIVFGYIYYLIESPISDMLIKYVKKNECFKSCFIKASKYCNRVVSI